MRRQDNLELVERIASVRQDARFALRQAAKAPGFTAIAALTLALGIGATTAIFSVVSGVLLKPLPWAHQDRLVQVWSLNVKRNHMSFADPTFDAVARSNVFAAIAEHSGTFTTTLASGGTAVPATTEYVSKGYFDVFSLKPLIGRFFVPEEQQLNAAPAVVISYDFWQRQFGGSPAAIGATFDQAGSTVTVVGVLPRGAVYPAGAELLLPREIYARYPSYTAHNWRVVARLAPNVSMARANAEVSSILTSLKAQIGDYDDAIDGTIVPLRDQIVGDIRPTLWLLFSAAAVLLLIACANVVNLLIARMASREGEVAVRLALGAGRDRLAQQFLIESFVLALAGCAGGLVLAFAGVRLLLALHPASIPRLSELGVDSRVLMFALGTSALAALGLGAIAAWRGVRGDLRSALSNAQRSQGSGVASLRVRGTLVVAQVAMTMVLLAGGAVLARSFIRLMHVDPGFRARSAVTINLVLDRKDNSPAALSRRDAFLDQAIAGLRALPGVTAVGGVSALPLTDGAPDGTYLVLDDAQTPTSSDFFERSIRDKTRTGSALYEMADSGYFATLGIPVLSGRVFSDRDAAGAPNVAVVSASLARKRWPGESPIGKVIEFGNMDGDMTPMTIVGVVGDVRDQSLIAEPYPALYASYRQRPGNGNAFSIVVTTSTPDATVASARRLLKSLRSDVPMRFGTLQSLVTQSVTQQRFMLVLVGVFGAVALLLAALGVYSVISYLVAQRGRELSIRVALGARGGDIMALVIVQGLTLVGLGTIFGVLGAALATRLLGHVLYDTSPNDPVAFGAVVALLCVVALVASYVPARRAALADPMDVIRSG